MNRFRQVKKVVHIIPYDGMGGVEEAARALGSFRDDALDFEVRYIFPLVQTATDRAKTNAIGHIVRCGIRLAKETPDLVILSLWRSVAVGLIAKCLNPRLKLVLFVHNARDAHVVDYLVTRLGLLLCTEVWADSVGSMKYRFSREPKKNVRIISYLVRKLEPLPCAPLAPVFAFWGRLSRQKNLPRALRLFSQIKLVYPQARFLIIGPEGDDSSLVRETIECLGLANHVEVLAARPFVQIPPLLAEHEVCFFLQASNYEGMSISVTEAMQLGLIPVVTPVGEISNYANSRNSILLHSVEEKQDPLSIKQILALLNSPSERLRKREAAISTWSESITYSESFLDTLAKALCLSPGNWGP